jgi:hypothetical protein
LLLQGANVSIIMAESKATAITANGNSNAAPTPAVNSHQSTNRLMGHIWCVRKMVNVHSLRTAAEQENQK